MFRHLPHDEVGPVPGIPAGHLRLQPSGHHGVKDPTGIEARAAGNNARDDSARLIQLQRPDPLAGE